MRGCTSSFGCLIYIFITFWVLLLSIFFISSAKWLTDRDFYVDTLTNTAFVDAIYDDMLPRLYNDNVFFRQVGEGDTSNEVFGQALREIVPQDYIVGEVSNIVDAVLAYVQGDRNSLDYRLNTEVIRANLNDPTRATQFATVLASRLPACDSSGQLYYGKSEIPACLPTGVSVEQFAGQISGNLSSLATNIPQEIALFDVPNRPEGAPEFKLTDMTQSFTQGVMVFAGIVLLITASMGADGLRSFFRRFGVMLLLPALLLFLGGQRLAEIQDNNEPITGLTITINDKVIRDGPLVDASQDVIRDLAGRTGNDLKTTSQVAIMIAVVVFALSLLPTPGHSGRINDSTLNLPPSGKVGRMRSNHNSPIQGI